MSNPGNKVLIAAQIHTTMLVDVCLAVFKMQYNQIQSGNVNANCQTCYRGFTCKRRTPHNEAEGVGKVVDIYVENYLKYLFSN